MVLDSFGVRSVGVGTRLCMMPYVAFLGLGCVLLPPWGKNRYLGFLGLGIIVPIRTGLGTVAVLVGSVLVVVILRNYLGVVIGTCHILADLYWFFKDLERIVFIAHGVVEIMRFLYDK